MIKESKIEATTLSAVQPVRNTSSARLAAKLMEPLKTETVNTSNTHNKGVFEQVKDVCGKPVVKTLACGSILIGAIIGCVYAHYSMFNRTENSDHFGNNTNSNLTHFDQLGVGNISVLEELVHNLSTILLGHINESHHINDSIHFM